jgi:hypothetical protein
MAGKFDNGRQGVARVGERLVQSVPFCDEFGENRRGNGKSPFGLGDELEWHAIEDPVTTSTRQT